MVDYSYHRMNLSFNDIGHSRSVYPENLMPIPRDMTENPGSIGVPTSRYSRVSEKTFPNSYQRPFSYPHGTDTPYYESCSKSKDLHMAPNLPFVQNRSNPYNTSTSDARLANYNSRYPESDCKQFKKTLTPPCKKTLACSTQHERIMADTQAIDSSKPLPSYSGYGTELSKANTSGSCLKNGRPQDTSVPTAITSRNSTFQNPASTEQRVDVHSTITCSQPMLTQGCHFINQAAQADLTLSRTATSCCFSSSNFSHLGYSGASHFPQPALPFEHPPYNNTPHDGFLFGSSNFFFMFLQGFSFQSSLTKIPFLKAKFSKTIQTFCHFFCSKK